MIIRGGAGAYEAAAISALIEKLLQEEAAALATPAGRPLPPVWTLDPAARPSLRAPLPAPAPNRLKG